MDRFAEKYRIYNTIVLVQCTKWLNFTKNEVNTEKCKVKRSMRDRNRRLGGRTCPSCDIQQAGHRKGGWF